MQVSWIDANEVRDLVALLAEPAPGSNSATPPDLDTLRDTPNRYGFPAVAEKPAPVSTAPAPVWTAPPPPRASATVASPPPQADVEAAILPDVNLIRERLRAIRDRAQQAGLLPKETPAERAARAAVTTAPAPAAGAQTSVVSHPPAAVPQLPAMAQYTAHAESSTAPMRTVLERLDEFARWCTKVTSSEEMFMLDGHGDLLWGSPTSGDYLICAKLAMTAGMRPQGSHHAPPSSTTNVQVRPGKELQLLSCPASHGNVTIALVNPKQVPIPSIREGFSLAVGG